jgi:hypothetical protein
MAGLIQIGAKVTQETADQFNEAFQASGCETKNQFYELILERYLNPKTKPVEVVKPSAQQIEEIQLKDNEIGQWNSMIETANQELQAEILRLTNLNSELESRQPEPSPVPELVEGQELITIPPIVRLVLDKEAAIAKRKTGKDFTHADILLNSFWESVEVGRVYPFYAWTKSDLVQLKKQLESTQV